MIVALKALVTTDDAAVLISLHLGLGLGLEEEEDGGQYWMTGRRGDRTTTATTTATTATTYYYLLLLLLLTPSFATIEKRVGKMEGMRANACDGGSSSQTRRRQRVQE